MGRNPGMVRYIVGTSVVNRHRRPILSGWTLVVLSVATLALGACGRKAGLDLPPSASSASTNVTPPVDSQAEAASKPSLFGSSYGADAPSVAAKGTKRSFVLDPLLGN